MSVLPYPHRRNDCGACRERDADFEVLSAGHALPDRFVNRFCRRCIGEFMTIQAMHGRPREISPGEPLTLTVRMLPPGADTW